MYQCILYNPEIPRVRERMESFLEQFDLSYEPLDTLYVVIDANENWLATGGRSGNVLKGFAVLDEYRSDGLFDMILSSLLTDSYGEEIRTLFVFTKKEYSVIFRSFGFVELGHTDISALLMRSDIGVDGILDSLSIDVEPGERVGAIVMNANPFTKGHKYLIETASRQVDKLIVFVVQNDASAFSFADRFELVKQGTKEFENLLVVPSTDLIVSKATFPSYFLKEKELISAEHARIDAKVFKRFFVPKFNIRTRFLGTEPLDASTAIYNRLLQEELPPECEVVILDRLKSGERVVSASAVRALLKEDRLDEIRDIVPPTTYEYLLRRRG